MNEEKNVNEVPMDIPSEEMPVETVPVEDAIVEDSITEDTITEDIPNVAEEVPAEEVPVDEAPVEEVPAEETPIEESPIEETPIEETPAEEAPTEATPSEEVPTGETPAEEVPLEDPDAELLRLAKDITPDKYSQYMEEIDRQYDERKVRRAERLEERKRKEHRGKILRGAALVLMLFAAGGCGWFAARGELPFSNLATARSNTPASTEVLTAETTEAATEMTTEATTEATTELTTEAASETVIETTAGETTVSPTDLGTEDPSAPTKTADEKATFDEIVAKKPQLFKGYEVDPAEGVTITDPDIVSTYAILLDCNTSEVLAQKEAGAVINPASMTKILTVLVAAEHLTQEDLDKTVEIDMETMDYAFLNKCSIVGFEYKEKVTVRDLFYGTILPSGGDAAYALAKYVAGSEKEFVKMMNDKLKDLGIDDQAHFTNVVGLYDEDHYCTVANMAVILKAAVEDDWCRQVLSCHTYTTSKNETHPDGITISNWFLRRIEDRDSHGLVLSAKTGFVNEAGCCAASFCIGNDGRYYICVTGMADSTWSSIEDHAKIYRTYIPG